MFTYIIHEYETDEMTKLIEKKAIASLKEVSNYLKIPASSISAYIDGRKCNRRLKRYKIVRCQPVMSPHRLELITTKMKEYKNHDERLQYVSSVLQDFAESLKQCSELE